MKTKGIFNDTVKVHTSYYGTQYVKPFDIFFSNRKKERYIKEARQRAKAKRRAELIESLQRMAGKEAVT